MAGRDYQFIVMPGDLQPYGPVGKENLDIIRLVFDMSRWLEAGEVVGSVIYPVVMDEPKLPIPPWQNDYPLDATSVTQPPPDDYPLVVVETSISGLSNQVNTRLGAGTPGNTYVVSVIVIGSTTRRRKQLDTLVTVEMPLNPSLVANMDVSPDSLTPPLIVGGTTTVPVGYNGRIYIENNSGPMTLTLPAAPTVLQVVAPVDLLGTANIYPITVAGAPGDMIKNGAGTLVQNLTSIYSYDDVRFEWTGDYWLIMTNRYASMG